jgi:hypothetical protein
MRRDKGGAEDGGGDKRQMTGELYHAVMLFLMKLALLITTDCVLAK